MPLDGREARVLIPLLFRVPELPSRGSGVPPASSTERSLSEAQIVVEGESDRLFVLPCISPKGLQPTAHIKSGSQILRRTVGKGGRHIRSSPRVDLSCCHGGSHLRTQGKIVVAGQRKLAAKIDGPGSRASSSDPPEPRLRPRMVAPASRRPATSSPAGPLRAAGAGGSAPVLLSGPPTSISSSRPVDHHGLGRCVRHSRVFHRNRNTRLPRRTPPGPQRPVVQRLPASQPS